MRFWTMWSHALGPATLKSKVDQCTATMSETDQNQQTSSICYWMFCSSSGICLYSVTTAFVKESASLFHNRSPLFSKYQQWASCSSDVCNVVHSCRFSYTKLCLQWKLLTFFLEHPVLFPFDLTKMCSCIDWWLCPSSRTLESTGITLQTDVLVPFAHCTATECISMWHQRGHESAYKVPHLADLAP